MQLYRSVLLAIELNPQTDHFIIKRAQQLLQEHAPELHLVHAIEHSQVYAEESGVAFDDRFKEKLHKEAAEEIDKLAQQLAIAKHAQTIAVGTASEIIMQQAKSIAADLIIIGSHGHRGWRMLLGSTAQSVLQAAHCDVLAVSISHN